MMPINFIHNQIQQTSAQVRDKLPLSVKLLAASTALMMLIVFSLAMYRLAPRLSPMFVSDTTPTSSDGDSTMISVDGTEVLPHLLPEEMQAALKKNPNCALELAQCSDGTMVGRAGPNCEFALCPSDMRPPSVEEVFNGLTPTGTSTPQAGTLPPMTDEEYHQWIIQTEIEDGIRSQ